MSGTAGPGSSALPTSENLRSEGGLISAEDPLAQAADPARSHPLEPAPRELPHQMIGPSEGTTEALSPASSSTAAPPAVHEMTTEESSVRDTSISPNDSSVTATSTDQEPVDREWPLPDRHCASIGSEPPTATTTDARSLHRTNSRTHFLGSTGHSQSISVQGQLLSVDSANNSRGYIRPNAPPRENWWIPWKISWWLLLTLFIITMSLVVTILTLATISIKNQGFTPFWDPPHFLAKLPAFQNNIWSQGVLYTSLPAFFMTLYSIMFSWPVACFMDLQPYMDLAKRGGATARTTIMLDYRRYLIFINAYVAFRNKHRLLAVYMLLSTVMAIAVIPLTAFLFLSSPVDVNTTVPISFTTAFNESSLSTVPDFGLAIDFAAGFRIYDASPPPWTDGEYAFPKVASLNTDSEVITNSNLTVETTGYSAYIDCRIIPEGEYNLKVVDSVGPPVSAVVIQISANDRGCAILNNFPLTPKTNYLGQPINTTIVRTWRTPDCSSATGYSRLSIASGLYSAAGSLTNFSLISCIPSYWTTPGTLTMTMTSLTGPPLIQSFSAYDNQAMESRSVAVANYVELNVQSIGCINPTGEINAFVYGKQTYVLASKSHPESALLPESILDAAQILFTSIYAVFVATSVFQPISPALNRTAINTTNVTRLVVMVPIAYSIVIILCGVALAILTMFWYSKKPNVLDEEPTGILSWVSILHGSNVTQLMNEVQDAPGYNGRMIEGLEEKGLGRDTVIMVKSYSPLRVIVPNLETELALRFGDSPE